MSDIVLDFQGGVSELLKDLKETKQALVDVRDSTASAKKEMQDSFKAPTKDAEVFRNELNKALKVQMEQKQLIEAMTRKMAELEAVEKKAYDSSDVKKYSDKIQELEKEVKSLSAQMNETAKGTDKSAKGVENLGKGTKVFSSIIGQAASAVKSFFAGFGIMAIVTLAIEKLSDFISKTVEELTGLSDEQKRLNEVNEKAIDGYLSQKVQMEILTDRVKQSGKSLKEKQDILKTYNKEFGDSIGKAKSYSDAEDYIIKRGPAFIESLKARANEMAAISLAIEAGKQSILLSQKAPEEFLNSLENGLYKADKIIGGFLQGQKGFSWLGSFMAEEAEAFEQQGKIVQFKQEAAEDKKQKTLIALADKYHMERQEKEKGFTFNYDKVTRTRNAKQVDLQKKINEQIIELSKDLAKAKVDAMSEGVQKEIAIEKLNSQQRIETFRRQLKEAKNPKIIELLNANIQQEEKNHLAKMTLTLHHYHENVIKAWDELQTKIEDIRKTDQQKEIDDINRHYDELKKSAEKMASDLREFNALTTGPKIDEDNIKVFEDKARAAQENRQKELNAVTTKYGLERIKIQEELALAQNDLLEKTGLKAEELERVKEVSRLNIVIEFAKKRLKILEAAGGEENKLAILQLKKVIADAKSEIKELTTKEEDWSIGKWLAGAMSIEEDVVQDAVNSFGNLLMGITEARKLAAQEEIEAIDKKIEKIQEEVEARSDALDREKDLMEQGYANNYRIEEQKLAEAKLRLDAETKNKEDAQKKYEAIQKREAAIRSASIAAQSVEQAVNLGTAATKIFSAHSGIPFVGVVLALAAVAAMIAGFFAIKNSIKAATTKAEKGRRVASGNRHSAGGNKYKSMDGNDANILEIEEGEWIVNRDSSEEFDPLLEAINSRRKLNVPRWELKRMLAPLGIQLEEDLPKKVVQKYEASKNAAVVVVNNKDESAEWEKQNRILEKLSGGKHTEYHDGYRIEREGSVTRIIHEKSN